MNIVEVEPEDPISADDWATAVADSREALHEWLCAKTQAFLAAGGQIQEFAPGATALEDGVHFMFAGKGTALADKSMKAHRERFNAASMAARMRRDAEAIAAIDKVIGDVETLAELARSVGITPPRCGRILKLCFNQDERAQRFIPKDRDERRKAHEADVLPKLRQAKADGMIGMYHIARTLGIAFDTVKYLDEKHNLQLPRGNKSNKRKYKAQFED